MNIRYKERVATFIANEVLAQGEIEPVNDLYADKQHNKREKIKQNDYIRDHKSSQFSKQLEEIKGSSILLNKMISNS